MLISMRKAATTEDIVRVVGALEDRGIPSQVVREANRVVVVLHKRRPEDISDLPSAAGGRFGHRSRSSLPAGFHPVAPRAHCRQDRRSRNRRRNGGGHRRAVLGRVARAGTGRGTRRARRRRQPVARRRIQAAHFSLRIPGLGTEGPAIAGRGARRPRDCRS